MNTYKVTTLKNGPGDCGDGSSIQFNSSNCAVGMALIVKLPESVACDILSNWLPAKALARLDVTCCNYGQRKAYLELLLGLHAPGIHHAHLGRPKYMNRMQWINTRHVKCTSFNYQTTYTDLPLSATDVSTINEFFRTQAAHLMKVHISSSDSAETAAILLHAMGDHKCCVNKLYVSAPSAQDNSKISVHFETILTNSAEMLSELELRCAVDFANFSSALHLPRLVKLLVEIATDEDLVRITEAAPALRDITLHNPWISQQSSAGLTAIAQHCPALQTFTIYCGDKLEVIRLDEGLAVIAQRCRNLQVLKLDSCKTLTDFGLTAVAAHCSQLIELTVCGCRCITDAPLIALSHSASANTLQVLNVSYCHTINGIGIVAIVTHCKSLHTLDVTHMNGLLNEHMSDAVQHMQNIHTLRCSTHITNNAFLHLVADNVPLLTHLEIHTNSRLHYTLECVTEVVEKCVKLTRLHLAENPATSGSETIEHWKTVRPGLLVSFPKYKLPY